MSSIVVSRARILTGDAAALGSAVVVSRARLQVAASAVSAVVVSAARITTRQDLAATIPEAPAELLPALSARVLSAAGSKGYPTRWEWRQIAGPPVTLAGATTATCTYIAPASTTDATVTLQLRVGTAEGWSAPATITDTIRRHRLWVKRGGLLVAGQVTRGIRPPVIDPPTSNADAGSLPVGQAEYPIPTGAIVVSTTGSDSAAGTIDAPLRTIKAAVAKANAGDTVVIREGEYHEGGLSTDNGIIVSDPGVTIQNAPGETVWLDGSFITTPSKWTRVGSAWEYPLTLAMDRSPSSARGALDATAAGWKNVDDNYPTAPWPEMLIFDGVPLRQVASQAEIGPDTFYVPGTASGSNNTIWTSSKYVIGRDPTGHEVRISNLGTALLAVADGVTFRGFGVRRYASSQPDQGVVKLWRSYCTAENMWLQDNGSGHSLSLALRTEPTARHCTIINAGSLGIQSSSVTNPIVDSCRIINPNTRHFNIAPGQAGWKAVKAFGLTCRNTVVEGGYGQGIWLDESVWDFSVTGCDITGVAGHGIIVELSDTGIIADNLIVAPGKAGIYTPCSDKVRVWNNTVVRPTETALGTQQDSRRPSNTPGPLDNRTPKPDGYTMSWSTDRMEWCNNLVVGDASRIGVMSIRSTESPRRGWRQFGPTIDGNAYQHTGSTPFAQIAQTDAAATNYTSLAAYRTATGLDAHSVQLPNTGTVIDELFRATPAATDAMSGVARPLPADIASLSEKAAGSLHVGAWR